MRLPVEVEQYEIRVEGGEQVTDDAGNQADVGDDRYHERGHQRQDNVLRGTLPERRDHLVDLERLAEIVRRGIATDSDGDHQTGEDCGDDVEQETEAQQPPTHRTRPAVAGGTEDDAWDEEYGQNHNCRKTISDQNDHRLKAVDHPVAPVGPLRERLRIPGDDIAQERQHIADDDRRDEEATNDRDGGDGDAE